MKKIDQILLLGTRTAHWGWSGWFGELFILYSTKLGPTIGLKSPVLHVEVI